MYYQVDFSPITTVFTCVCLGLKVIFPTCYHEICLLLSNLLPKVTLRVSYKVDLRLPENPTNINIWPPMFIQARIKKVSTATIFYKFRSYNISLFPKIKKKISRCWEYPKRMKGGSFTLFPKILFQTCFHQCRRLWIKLCGVLRRRLNSDSIYDVDIFFILRILIFLD